MRNIGSSSRSGSTPFSILCRYLPNIVLLMCVVASEAPAQTPPNITSSGLNTTIAQNGNVYDITGGTRPANGPNVYYSFGDFGLVAGETAHFLNTTPLLTTTNLLGRVTGGNPSSIFGTIDTMSFPGANLFLLNPAGIIFGPTAQLNVGGSAVFTTADYFRLTDGALFHWVSNVDRDALLSAAPVAAFGFLGSTAGTISVQGSSLAVPESQSLLLVGGNLDIGGTIQGEAFQPARLTAPGGTIKLASSASPGELSYPALEPSSNINGEILSHYATAVLGSKSVIDFTHGSSGRISIRGGQLMMDIRDSLLDTITEGASNSTQDRIALGGGSSITANTSNEATSVEIVTGSLELRDGAQIVSRNVSENPGGSITIEATDHVTITGIALDQSAPGVITNIGVVTSGVFSTTTGSGSGSPITIHTPTLTIEETGQIATMTTGDEAGGAVTLDLARLGVNSGGQVTTLSGLDPLTGDLVGTGAAGDILVTASESVSINGQGEFGNPSTLQSISFGEAVGGAIMVEASLVRLENDGRIETTTFGSGGVGDITLLVDDLFVKNGGLLTTSGSDAASSGNIFVTAANTIELADQSNPTQGGILNLNTVNGGTGTIMIQTENLRLSNGARLMSNTFSSPTPDTGSKVSIHASKSVELSNNSAIRVINFSSDVGALDLTTHSLSLSGQSTISTTTSAEGNGGPLMIKADDVTLSGGSQLTTSSTQGIGRAGDITLNVAGSLTLTGSGLDSFGRVVPTGIFSSTTAAGPNPGATGDGGQIAILAQSVEVNNGAKIDASTNDFALGRGGNVSIRAFRSVVLRNNASIAARSTGVADAGNITINAGNRFEARDSSVTTKSEQAGGGNIEINALDHIWLVNSQVNASAFLDGGNISIDPNVVILQNSQILAQAIQGAGGNITIVTPLFLADQASLVSASSQFGLNGTVTIQSPTSNLSGSLGTLTSKPSQAQSLLTQRCAALVNGQASSFIVAGREQLPSDPGSWLTSPLALAGIDADDTSNLKLRTSNLLATDRVSLRRLTPARFLMANFAESEATGCHS